jgi:hypothetical protein
MRSPAHPRSETITIFRASPSRRSTSRAFYAASGFGLDGAEKQKQFGEAVVKELRYALPL